jgi:hypothetical protein
MPFCKVGFSVPKLKKRPFVPNSKLKIIFRYYLSTNKHHRSNFGMNLTFLCHLWVAIPERSNLSIFDHPFKCPHEVLWMLRIKIFTLFDRRRSGLSKMLFLLFFWHLVLEESLGKFGEISHICQKYRFSRLIQKVCMASFSFLFLFYKLQLL